MAILAHMNNFPKRTVRGGVFGIIFVTLFLLVAFITPSSLYAQDISPTIPTPSSQQQTIDPFFILSALTPNTENNVSWSQHTFMQSFFIEANAAIICALAGVDIMNPGQQCLDINPQTHKLGYTQNAPTVNNSHYVGGLMGGMVSMIGGMYSPVVNTGGYIHYVASNFGITNRAYAQAATGGAFNKLNPLLPIWQAIRNISFLLLILAFIFIGLGVMLRVRIDPRTVMTIQNQIPRVIIAIIFITFSYAIVAFLADMMWAITYAGINAMTSAAPNTNPRIPDCSKNDSIGNTDRYFLLNQAAEQDLLTTPLQFVNDLFTGTGNKGALEGKAPQCFPFFSSGIVVLTSDIAGSVGDLISTMIQSMFGIQTNSQQCVDFGKIVAGGGFINFGTCMAGLIGSVAKIVFAVVIFVMILLQLFKVWFELLKAFVVFLIYLILGPLWIVFGLLPGRPLGIEKWLRGIVANLLPFPLIAFLFVGGRIVQELFKKAQPGDIFTPPLFGNPLTPNFGSILILGILLIAPSILKQMREALKAQGNKYTGAALAGGIASGRAIAGVAPNKMREGLMRRNQMDNRAIGYGAQVSDRVKFGLAGIFPKLQTRMQRNRNAQFGAMIGVEEKRDLKSRGINIKEERKAREDRHREKGYMKPYVSPKKTITTPPTTPPATSDEVGNQDRS